MHEPTPVAADGDSPSRAFAAAQRLRKPREFAAVLSAARGSALRANTGWLAMTAAWTPAAQPPFARLGLTLPRRMAKRAIDRALVKRVVRESFRHSAARLGAAAASAAMRIDINVKLARTLPLPGEAARPALRALKQVLRGEADRLFDGATQRMQRLAVESNVAASTGGPR